MVSQLSERVDKAAQDINPLLAVVLRALREQASGISEYELLKYIEADGAHFTPAQGARFSQTDGDAQLALFQKHFMIMNALYRLQDSLWRDESVWLTISPLRIAIETKTDARDQQVAAHGDDALRNYYLDWQQFLATDSAAVSELLASFWTRYAAHDQRAAALATLQLGDEADWNAIRQQYRRLAAASHPDRGGDAAQFLAVRAAYEILRELT
ncbi:MAG: DNA-J related domain-containing protein [Spongiibacteraceae bacterium]